MKILFERQKMSVHFAGSNFVGKVARYIGLLLKRLNIKIEMNSMNMAFRMFDGKLI
jgi:hypothetical protein